MTYLADIEDALASCRIHEGFPAERRAMAGKLLAEGCTVADIERLSTHCTNTVRDPGCVPRVLFALLRDKERRCAKLADLALVQRAIETRAKKAPCQAPQVRQTTLPKDTEWESYAQQRRAAGMPLVGPREPHAWERQGR